jgi:CubicO group peptidase (beta-lactamase class C family)
MRNMSKTSPYLFFWILSTAAFAAPDEQQLGRDQGYPRAPSVNVGSQDQYIVDSNSGGWESFLPTTRVAAGSAMPLPVTKTPTPIQYQFGGQRLNLQDYLNRRRVTSLIIIKNGEIHHEHYQYGRNHQHRFNSASMAKSILGLLVGIAIDEGKIRSINDTIEQYVPKLKGTIYQGITIKDLLTMSTGLSFDEANYSNPNNDYAQMVRQQYRVGGIDALLSLNMVSKIAEPGTMYRYSSLDSELLGHVVSAAVKKPLAAYASEKLWSKIGAESDATWQIDAQKKERTHCCFGARSKDYAKIGVLLANNGEFQGSQVIQKDWIDQMTAVSSNHLARVGIGLEPKIYGYGYHVWLKNPTQFLFRGLRGQTLYVDRANKIVMVQTAVWRLGDPTNNSELEAFWSGVVRSLQ